MQRGLDIPIWSQEPFDESGVGLAETRDTIIENDLREGDERQNISTYGAATVEDHATLWQGDNHGTLIHNNYYSSEPRHNKYRVLLDSLTFDRMDARLRNVAAALPTTCEWLITHDQFIAWNDSTNSDQHHGFLWIKGKPGSGKSTIMKKTVAWAENAWSDQIILKYFFNARSPDALEKSSLGLYRSMVHQLLTACPDGTTLFTTRFASKERNGKFRNEWEETELQNFLIEYITTYSRNCVIMFIDALDEGTDDDVRDLVEFLERLTLHSISNGRSTRVCLSSRHYPRITVSHSLTVVLEKQSEHSRDINVYIKGRLQGEPGEHMNTLQELVCNRAAGVFLWVVLVVVMLNKLHDQGKRPATILQKVNEVPRELHQVFANITTRDPEEMEERNVLFRWVLYALRPLRPAELYIAVQTGSSQDPSWNQIPTEDGIQRYLLNCSRGLVELTTTRPPTVQFIHETVRDFMTGKSVPGNPSSSTSQSKFRDDQSHMVMAEECVRYLISIGSETASNQSGDGNDAFLEYAAKHWWEHLQRSGRNCSPTLTVLIQDLLMQRSSLLTWVRHYNIDKPDRGFDPLRKYSDLAPPLYYAARLGLLEVVSGLLERGVNVNAPGGSLANALQAASDRGYVLVVKVLLQAGARVNAQGGEYSNALQAASWFGHEAVVRLLLEAGAKVNIRDQWGHTALQAASLVGSEVVVQMLLDEGADVNAKGGKHGCALQAASLQGHERIIQMLFRHGADANVQGGFFGTALQAAVSQGHEKIVDLLLGQKADPDIAGGFYGSALKAASNHKIRATLANEIHRHSVKIDEDWQKGDEGRWGSRIRRFDYVNRRMLANETTTASGRHEGGV